MPIAELEELCLIVQMIKKAILLMCFAGAGVNAQNTTTQIVNLQLERSVNDLNNWQSVPVTTTIISGGLINIPLTSSQAFYRLRIAVESNPTDTMITVEGGILPQNSEIAGTSVAKFQIGRTEVTYGEWKSVRDYALLNGYSFDNFGYGSSDRHPVGDVSWYDAVKWCNAKSQQLGLMPVYYVGGQIYKSGQSQPIENASANGYRLPKEAEWEWAARGGVMSKGYIYSGSDNPNDVAWFLGTSGGSLDAMVTDPVDPWYRRGTWPVGIKTANELGIYDMSGNVEEWISDYLSESNSRRVRGGNWEDPSSRITVKDRSHGGNADYRFNVFGFRIAKNY